MNIVLSIILAPPDASHAILTALSFHSTDPPLPHNQRSARHQPQLLQRRPEIHPIKDLFRIILCKALHLHPLLLPQRRRHLEQRRVDRERFLHVAAGRLQSQPRFRVRGRGLGRHGAGGRGWWRCVGSGGRGAPLACGFLLLGLEAALFLVGDDFRLDALFGGNLVRLLAFFGRGIFQLLFLLQVLLDVLRFLGALAAYLLVPLLVDLVLVREARSLLRQLQPEFFQLRFLLLFAQRRDLFGRFGEVDVLRLGGVEFGLRLAAELLAAVVADQTSCFFAWL